MGVNPGQLNAFEVRILAYILLLWDAVLLTGSCGVKKTIGSSTKFCVFKSNTSSLKTLHSALCRAILLPQGCQWEGSLFTIDS